MRSVAAACLRSSLLLFIFAVLLSGCEQEQPTPTPQLTVSVYDVGNAVIKRNRKFHGRVVPADLTSVSFRIPGKIKHLAVQAGQAVTAGQVIAQIEDSIQRQVLADARARQQLSRRQLERAENLFRIGALTPAQRDQLNAAFRLASANLKLAEASLSYTVVTAPFDGTVADVEKEVFEAVAAGETVVTVYRTDRTDVLVNIPDILPARIHQAKDITAFEAKVVFSGSPHTYAMHYLKGSPARNPKTQAFQFWLTMPATQTPFPPGLPATVTADLQEAGFATDTGLVVPLTALEAGSEPGVFRAWRYEAGVVNPVMVTISNISQGGALISSGLRARDRVVTSGLSRLRPGMEVSVQSQNQER